MWSEGLRCVRARGAAWSRLEGGQSGHYGDIGAERNVRPPLRHNLEGCPAHLLLRHDPADARPAHPTPTRHLRPSKSPTLLLTPLLHPARAGPAARTHSCYGVPTTSMAWRSIRGSGSFTRQ